MRITVDWRHRVGHAYEHGVETQHASEAVNDELAVWLDPDPSSESGLSVRVIGFSPSFSSVLIVILVRPDADDERPNGQWWGASAWRANTTYRRMYREANES